MNEHPPIRRALISCFDKTGVAELATALDELGVAIVSTGSTAGVIRDAGISVTDVADVTGFPECLDGRVKTLHPTVHAGILADRGDPDHVEQLSELEIEAFDLVVVNLYPFSATVAAGADDDEIIEMIDIGGPAMIRAAAKNHGSVGVVVEPGDYDLVVDELRAHGGLSAAVRLDLARRAFRHTARYDAAVASWFEQDAFPAQLSLALGRTSQLRYGENPHQGAALYAFSEPASGIAGARQHHGKELSYNNLIDTDAAWRMVTEQREPCVAIIKHTNPAGYAIAGQLDEAYARALDGDPVSAFGGIVAANRPIDVATAERIGEVFTEVVVAPGYTADAMAHLTGRKNLRILECALPDSGAGDRPASWRAWSFRSIDGGLLVQDDDVAGEPWDQWQVVTDAAPDAETMADLRFAWVAAKHTKSNAIVLVRDGQVVGVGAGQMSRVDSVRLAIERSGGRHRSAVLASDAFFPFRDGPDAAAAAEVRAIVQPGGSVRDDEVVAAANEHDIPMVFTARRHFRH